MQTKRSDTDRIILVDNIKAFIWVVENAFDKIASEFNLRSEDSEAIVDWVIIELMSKTLIKNNIRIIGHYRNDEGMLVFDALSSTMREAIEEHFQKRFGRFTSTDIKVLITGSQMFSAIKDENAARL